MTLYGGKTRSNEQVRRTIFLAATFSAETVIKYCQQACAETIECQTQADVQSGGVYIARNIRKVDSMVVTDYQPVGVSLTVVNWPHSGTLRVTDHDWTGVHVPQEPENRFFVPHDGSVCQSHVTRGALGRVGKLDFWMARVFGVVAAEPVVGLVVRPPEKKNGISVGQYHVVHALGASQEILPTLFATEEMFDVAADRDQDLDRIH